jgi:hypothetical protein
MTDFLSSRAFLQVDQNCVDGKASAVYKAGILADQLALQVHEDTRGQLSSKKNLKDGSVKMDVSGGWFILRQFVWYLIEQKKIHAGSSPYRVLWDRNRNFVGSRTDMSAKLLIGSL